MLGVLIINKPLGLTSHDVVAAIRRKFGIKRVGHAGSLDPAATGVLVVAVGPATRFLQYLPLEPKVYEGTFKFGQTTNTQDREGEVLSNKQVPSDLEAKIRSALPKFHGAVEQLPPMFSAVKKDGQPLYAYARKGQEVERESRVIFVDRFELRKVEPPFAEVSIVCSGGTYIRTLAHDLGQQIGCGAYLSSLCRTEAGRFTLDHGVSLEHVSEKHLISLKDALPPMPLVQLTAAQERLIRDGRWTQTAQFFQVRYVGLLDQRGEVFSVARTEGRKLHPDCVVPQETVTHAL